MTTTEQMTPGQEGALERLRERLVARAGLGDPAIAGDLHEPTTSNVFGILGARGSGKSTLLTRLGAEGPDLGSHAVPGFERLELAPPLDCSVLPSEVAPGTAVLLRLQEHLKAEYQDCSTPKQGIKESLSKLEELCGLYSRTEQGYRDLCLDLSTTPDDYTRYLVSGLRERFGLRTQLADWLAQALELLDRDAFVVSLDDFDLVKAREVRRWLLSLLDELHQSRLLFVITADFYRLQHLSWDATAQLDDKTGRALLDKLLPSLNRIELTQWLPADRRSFKPFEKALIPGIQEESVKNLWQLAKAFIPDSGSAPRLIEALLPFWPRGLDNLYRSLEAWEQRSKTVDDLLTLLASCRGEPLLARRLEEVEPGQWSTVLAFAETELSVEKWDELVNTACSHGKSLSPEQHGWRPLRSMRPTSPQDIPSSAEQNASLAAMMVAQFGTQDPLRHEQLQLRSLRDAAEQDVPLWTELLLDIAFERTPRSRIQFFDSWAPIVRRVEGSSFSIVTSRHELRELLEVDGALSSRAALFWLLWENKRENKMEQQIRIGWRPMFDASRWIREPIPFELLKELRIEVRGLGGALPAPETAHSLLPRETWACILLVDGLSRCPWSAFSMPLGLNLVTYLGLAAAFVRTAYLYALHRAAPLAREDLSDAQTLLLDGLLWRDPSELLRLDEEQVLERLARVLRDPVPELDAQDENPLATACRDYLSSPIYKDVVALVERKAVDWGLAVTVKAQQDTQHE